MSLPSTLIGGWRGYNNRKNGRPGPTPEGTAPGDNKESLVSIPSLRLESRNRVGFLKKQTVAGTGPMNVDWKEFLHSLKTIPKSLKDEVIPKRWDMQELAKNFFEGLFLVVPVAVTIYVVFLVFNVIDGWLNIPVPGMGFLITIGMLILVGRLASNVFFRGVLSSLEKILTRTPFVKLVYTSLKDLIEAFMGKKKRFDQPVLVTLVPGGYVEAIGFVTRQNLDLLGLEDRVAVYFPQSYNFAGNLLVVPRSQIRPLEADSADVMTFIVSGGVSGGAANGKAAGPPSALDGTPALPSPTESQAPPDPRQ